MRPERWLYTIPLRLRSLLQRRDADQNLDAELRDHIEQKTEAYVAQGMAPEAACRAALLEMGGVEQTKEKCRDARRVNWLHDLAQDVRYALRILRKSPGFTAVAILTLALGIGANTTIFSAVNGIILQPLPYPDSSRLAVVVRRQIAWGMSLDEVAEIQKFCPAIQRIAPYNSFQTVISYGDSIDKPTSAFVSGDFFPILGIKPLLGRPILDRDTQPGNERVVVLSYRLWMSLFGGDPRIVGRTIIVNETPYGVIGVMPKKFEFGVNGQSGVDEGLWAPLLQSSDPQVVHGRDGAESLLVLLGKGVTRQEAAPQLRTVSARLAAALPPEERAMGGKDLDLEMKSLAQPIYPGNVARNLPIVLAAVGFVLLLACVNLGALLMARTSAREHEFAIRRTLGATPARIARQLLSESFLLAATGGAFGLLFSLWGIRLLRAIAPPGTPRLDELALDNRVLCFTLGISALSAILFGLAPALQAASRRIGKELSGGLGESFAGHATRRRHALRTILIVSEVALAVILVSGGALMGRSLYKLMNLDTGVHADHAISMDVSLTQKLCNQKTWATCVLAAHKVLDSVRALPGVQQAALMDLGLSMNGGGMLSTFGYPGGPTDPGLFVEGRPGNELTSEGIESRGVTSHFFSAMGISMLSGRDFTSSDMNGPLVAIVSHAFARKFLSPNPVGMHFRINMDKGDKPKWIEVVGLVGDVRDRGLHNDGFPLVPVYYLPGIGGDQWGIIARASADPTAMVPAIRRIVRSVDKYAPITNIETVDQLVAESAAMPRFDAVLLGSFGAFGLLLAVIGIYGVISSSVAQRTHEIGVRMALGAQRRDVLLMVLGQAGALAVCGIVLGLAGALGLTRFLRSMLFEITPTDPATLAAIAASWIPARRAACVDPMVALRHE